MRRFAAGEAVARIGPDNSSDTRRVRVTRTVPPELVSHRPPKEWRLPLPIRSHGGAGYGKSVAPVEPVHHRPRSSSRHDWRMLAVAALLTVAAACGHKIGDSCGNS